MSTTESADTGTQGDERADRQRELTTSRREFLRIAAGVAGVGAGLALTSGSSRASIGGASTSIGRVKVASSPRLRARAAGTVERGVQRLRSESTLSPPAIRIDVRAKRVEPGVVLTTSAGGRSQQGALIFDTNGRLVWFQPAPPGQQAANLRVQTYLGEPVLTWFEGVAVSGHGVGHYEIYDQQYRQIAQVNAGNGYQGDLHEFLLTDRGTALFTCYGRAVGRLPGGRRGAYFYGVVQEVDVATGSVLFQWRSDQHVDLEASFERMPSKPGNTWDYFHINSISIDPTDQNLLISSRNTWAVYKVNRTTGRVIWKLGGKGSGFKMGPGTHFAFQHHVTLHPGGILTVFDNEDGPPAEASQSRALILSINERTRRVSLRAQYHHHPPVLSIALGSVQPLDQRHTFVGWGPSSYFTEYGAAGQVLFDGRLASGASSYRAFKDVWTGQPASPPAVRASRSGSVTQLYVSWNGATDVAQWSVLGANDARALTQLGVADVAGFETEIAIPNAPSLVAVQAVDAAGTLLGTSTLVSA